MHVNPVYLSYQPQYIQPHGKKLFVGQIPKTMNETDVTKIFSDSFPIMNVCIIKDRNTHEHKGCAFIYVDPNYACNLIEKFHNKFKCDGMSNPIQVKFANSTLQNSNTMTQLVSLNSNNVSTDSRPVIASVLSTQFPASMYPANTIDGNIRDDQHGIITVLTPQQIGVYSIPYYQIYQPNMMVASTNMYPSFFQSILPFQQMTTNDGVIKNRSADTKESIAQSTPFNMIYSTLPAYPTYYAMQQPVIIQSTAESMKGQIMTQSVGVPDQSNQGTTQSHYSTGYIRKNEQSSPLLIPTMVGDIYTSCHQGETKHNHRHDGPADANLFVYNISPKYTDLDLQNVFSKFGMVVSARVIRNEDGNSKGYGFVNFSKVEEAMVAIKEMDGQSVDGKILTVQIKKDRMY